MAVGVAGLLSVVPPLNDVGMVFGLLQIVWFVGLGTAMLRTAQPAGQALAPEAEPA